jgi:DNA primase
MRIRNLEVDVDIYEELMNYSWNHGDRKGDEFVCCSPFREEQHPSFSINLETGLWIDFGSQDEYWKKGSFIKLLAFLENISYEEAEEMLLDAYGIHFDDEEELVLNINIQELEAKPKEFTREELKPYLFRNKQYLLKRGISEEIMKKFVVGYDKEKQAVAFFWRDNKTGKVVTVKFRSTKGKQFYYIDGGQPVKNHIFGLYEVKQGGYKEVFIVESEIDALYLWSIGVPAIALGGSNLSEAQRRLLLLSGIETMVLAVDNDKAGYKIKQQLIKELSGYLNIKELYIPPYAKDVNDLSKHELLNYVENIEDVEMKII